jgi:hypothetical protein
MICSVTKKSTISLLDAGANVANRKTGVVKKIKCSGKENQKELQVLKV